MEQSLISAKDVHCTGSKATLTISVANLAVKASGETEDKDKPSSSAGQLNQLLNWFYLLLKTHTWKKPNKTNPSTTTSCTSECKIDHWILGPQNSPNETRWSWRLTFKRATKVAVPLFQRFLSLPRLKVFIYKTCFLAVKRVGNLYCPVALNSYLLWTSDVSTRKFPANSRCALPHGVTILAFSRIKNIK